jgi:ubiquinone/menaquinone biosynthesis C-methylase UbiE
MMGDGTDIGAFYDAAAERYAARFATAELLDAEASYISRLVSIPHSPCDVMLDIGCGPALYYPLAVASRLRYVGVDVSQAMLNIGRQRYPEADLILASAEKLPIADTSVSVAVAMGCLSHLRPEDFSTAISEVARVVRPGGGFLLGDQLGDGVIKVPFPFLSDIEVDVLTQTRGQYHAALSRAGFSVLNEEVRDAQADEMAMDKILIWAQRHAAPTPMISRRA